MIHHGDCVEVMAGMDPESEMEGFEWIGIEREAEYVAIAEARLNGTQRGLGLDVGAPEPKGPTKKDGAIGGNGLGGYQHFVNRYKDDKG